MSEYIQNYWRNPDDADNAPGMYAKAIRRSLYLIGLVKRFVRTDETIVEPGCNVGRNLNTLLQLGYRDLAGIEINPDAIKLGAEIYPELYRTANIRVMRIEDWLELGEQYDCLLTMAVLEHIPNYETIEWIGQATRRTLITIEDERSATWKHYPRDYHLFTKLGFEQVFRDEPGSIFDLAGMTARVFMRLRR